MFDNFDLKLLNALQDDADRTAEELAQIIAPVTFSDCQHQAPEESGATRKRTIALLASGNCRPAPASDHPPAIA